MITAGIIGFNKTPIPIPNKSNSTANVDKYSKIIEVLIDNIDEYNVFYKNQKSELISFEHYPKKIAQKLCNILHIRKQLKMTKIDKIKDHFDSDLDIPISEIISLYKVSPTISLDPDSELNENNENKLFELIKYLTTIDYENYRFGRNYEGEIESAVRDDNKIKTLLQKLADMVYIREKLLLSVKKTIPMWKNHSKEISISEILKHYSITPSDKYTRIFTVNL